MELKKRIKQQIKDLYGSQHVFCEQTGMKYKDLSRKIKVFEGQIERINDFLELLQLDIKLNYEKRNF
jgi:hypothetical protein